MATSCPIGFDKSRLHEEIELIYARVATEPSGEFHFHRGPRYAAEILGYDAVELAELPAAATASFAGVANPHAIDAIRPGDTVVDIGSGAGMDLLLAARRAGPPAGDRHRHDRGYDRQSPRRCGVGGLEQRGGS